MFHITLILYSLLRVNIVYFLKKSKSVDYLKINQPILNSLFYFLPIVKTTDVENS